MKNKIKNNYSNKTILFMIDDFHIGGVVSFIKQYSNILISKGYRIIILGKKGELNNPKKFFPKGCTLVIIPTLIKRGSLLSRYLDFLEYSRYLKYIYYKYEVDILHLSLVWSSLYSLVIPLTWRKKRIITFYGAYDLENSSMFKFYSKLFVIKLMMMRFLHLFILLSSSRIITFSQYAKDLIQNHFSRSLSKKIKIVEGFIPDSKINFIKSKRKLKEDLIINLVNFGRAEPRKGLDILLKASKLLIEIGYKVNLFIATPVSYLSWTNYLSVYENLDLFDNVRFFHSVSDKRKEEMLSKADLFVMPSKDLETFGMTIIESMAKGVPVIGSNIGAIPEILSKVDRNLIFEPNAIDLARTVIWYKKLSSREKDNLRIKSYEVIKKYYSESALKNKIMSLYY